MPKLFTVEAKWSSREKKCEMKIALPQKKKYLPYEETIEYYSIDSTPPQLKEKKQICESEWTVQHSTKKQTFHTQDVTEKRCS